MATKRSYKLLESLMTQVIRLGPGATMPNQLTLSLQHNCSRTLLRECMAILEYLNVVEVRPKIGTIINAPIKWTTHRDDVLKWANESFAKHGAMNKNEGAD